MSGVAFHNIATSASRQRRPLKATGVVLAHDKNMHGGKFTLENPGGIQAVHGRHGNVEQYQVRVMFPGLTESISTVRSLAYHFDIDIRLGLEYLADAPAHTLVVIDHKHAKWQTFHGAKLVEATFSGVPARLF